MATYAFILAGGRGERLWPLSTTQRPKPFLTLLGGKSLLAHAVDRLHDLLPTTHIYVITSADLVPATTSALPQLPPENIIGEPCSRDTAAAVALACGIVAQRDPEGVTAILTADHVIADEAAFRTALSAAFSVAQQEEAIVTFGVNPTFPATTYGYLECGETLPLPTPIPFRTVRRFVEKPDAATARAYLETGAFVWNAGMFVFRVEVMAAAFRAVAPQWLPLIDAPQEKDTLYPTLPSCSIDYAVMEKGVACVTACVDFGWDDVGSLPALAAHFPADDAGNVTLAPCVTLDAKRCFVVDERPSRLTALVGVEDLMVVQTEKATLICPTSSATQLKALVSQLPEAYR